MEADLKKCDAKRQLLVMKLLIITSMLLSVLKWKNIVHVSRTRFGMHPFAGNYSHDRRFARNDWLCRCRQAKESESHLLSGECEVYGDIRDEFNNLEILTISLISLAKF